MIEIIVFRPNQPSYKTLLEMPGEEAMHRGLIFENKLFSVNYAEYPAPKNAGIKRIWYAVEQGMDVDKEQVLDAEKKIAAE